MLSTAATFSSNLGIDLLNVLIDVFINPFRAKDNKMDHWERYGEKNGSPPNL